MATALLIAGYLLAIPPLIFFGKMWRERRWLLYLPAVLGALCAGAGWFLKGVPYSTAVHMLWAIGFGISFPAFAGRGKRWWVALATGLVGSLALSSVGFYVLKTRFGKTKMSKVSEKEAVSEFRRKQGKVGGVVEGTPASGVYKFTGKGQYTIAVPGLDTDKRVLPKTLPAVLVSEGRCWILDTRFFKQHTRKVRYCADKDGGMRMKYIINHNEFFGLKNITKSRCEPDLIIPPGAKKGHQVKQTCRPMSDTTSRFGKANAKATWTYLGTEPLTIGGKKRSIHHMRRVLIIKSLQSAHVEQHLYYDVQTKMLVRYWVKGSGSGLANFKSDYQIDLVSLTPKR